MFKYSALISLLLQQSDITAFGLHFTSTPKVLNLSSKVPQKISLQIFFYPSWQNKHTHRSTVLHLVTVSSILIISIC